MHHQYAAGRRELDGKVPVADRIERVFGGAIEAEQFRRVLPIHRIGGTGERSCPEGHDVDPLAAIREPLAVTRQHLEPGEHVVAEGHRLGRLKVGETGQDGIGLAFGEIDQRMLQPFDATGHLVDGAAQPQPHVRGHLVVTRTARVEFFTRITDVGGKRRLYIHVDVFEGHGPLELAPIDAIAYPFQPGDDKIPLRPGQHPLTGQHGRVGDRTLDIL